MTPADRFAELLGGEALPSVYVSEIMIRFPGPDRVYVTITTTRSRGERGWAFGLGCSPKHFDLDRYKGRGWQERMADDILAEHRRVWGQP